MEKEVNLTKGKETLGRDIVRVGLLSNWDYLETISDIKKRQTAGEEGLSLPFLTETERNRIDLKLPVVIEEFRKDAKKEISEGDTNLLIITSDIIYDRYYATYNDALDFFHDFMKDCYGDPSLGKEVTPVCLLVNAYDLSTYFFKQGLNAKARDEKAGTFFCMMDDCFEDFKTQCRWITKLDYTD